MRWKPFDEVASHLMTSVVAAGGLSFAVSE